MSELSEYQIIQHGIAAGRPRVDGFCPACGWDTLFLGANNRVTCSFLDCPNPSMVNGYLHKRNIMNDQISNHEEFIPPLPSEPWTVIRVTWGDGGRSVLVLQASGNEWTWVQTQHSATTESVHKQGVESFEVLAEPVDSEDYRRGLESVRETEERVRRETAKAVLDRVISSAPGDVQGWDLGPIAREFGVES